MHRAVYGPCCRVRVANPKAKTLIAGRLRPKLLRIRNNCVTNLHQRVERLVIDRHGLRPIEGLCGRLRNDNDECLAEIERTSVRQNRLRLSDRGIARRWFGRNAGGPTLPRQSTEPVRRRIRAGPNTEHARQRQGGRGFNSENTRMGIKRAYDGHMSHAVEGKIGDVSPLARQQAGIFDPADGFACETVQFCCKNGINSGHLLPLPVIPAKAGIQSGRAIVWIPAFAGMTVELMESQRRAYPVPSETPPWASDQALGSLKYFSTSPSVAVSKRFSSLATRSTSHQVAR